MSITDWSKYFVSYQFDPADESKIICLDSVYSAAEDVRRNLMLERLFYIFICLSVCHSDLYNIILWDHLDTTTSERIVTTDWSVGRVESYVNKKKKCKATFRYLLHLSVCVFVQ